MEGFEVARTGIRARTAHTRDDPVEDILDTRALSIQIHPCPGDALAEQALAGSLERRVVGGPGLDSPRRGHAEALLVQAALVVTQGVARRLIRAGEPRTDHHVRCAGGQCERDVPRVPHAAVRPDMLAQLTRPRGTLQHRGELWPAHPGHHPRRAHGTGTDTDLDDVGSGLHQVGDAVGRRHVTGRDGHLGVDPAYGTQRVDHAFLVPMGGVDHQDVDARVEQRLRLGCHVSADTDRRRDPQPPLGVGGRHVQAGPERALAGQHADDATITVHDRGQPVSAAMQPVERLLGADAVRQREQICRHDTSHLGEPVGTLAVGLGHHTDRPAVLDDDDRAVGPLGQQVQRLTHRARRFHPQRGVIDDVTLLRPRDHIGDDIHRDVLWDHRQAATPGKCLGHPPPGHRRHVRGDDRDRGAAAVQGAKVHVEP